MSFTLLELLIGEVLELTICGFRSEWESGKALIGIHYSNCEGFRLQLFWINVL